MSGTREVFVIDTFRGPHTYTELRDLASAIVGGAGLNLATASFTATVRVLTDGATPALDLTSLCEHAALDCHRECTATDGIRARADVHRHHTDALVLRVKEHRANARIKDMLGMKTG